MHVLTARGEELSTRRRALLVTGAALAPDVDFLWKLLDGQNHHQQETHSIGAAVLAGALVWLLALARRWPGAGALGLAVAAGWGSHLFLDYLGRDTHPPIGLLALWPLHDGYFKFPWPIFLDIGRTLDWTTLAHNSQAVAWEALLLSPLLVASWRARASRGGA